MSEAPERTTRTIDTHGEWHVSDLVNHLRDVNRAGPTRPATADKIEQLAAKYDALAKAVREIHNAKSLGATDRAVQAAVALLDENGADDE